MKGNQEQAVQKLFDVLSDNYHSRQQHIAMQAYPVVKDVYESRGGEIENIVVPFTDGARQVQVLANLKKAYENKGLEIPQAFERFISLSVIDEEWKEHLREMDELKQSAQNAVFEQKDPLLVYKLESFQLFKKNVVYR